MAPALIVSASNFNNVFLKTISKIKEAIRNLKVRNRKGVVNDRAIFTAIKDEPQIIVMPRRYKSALNLDGVIETLFIMKQSIMRVREIQETHSKNKIHFQRSQILYLNI